MKIDKNIIQVNQFWKKSYLWTLSFSELDRIARLTFRTDWEDMLFQRDEEAWRVREIAKYISNEINNLDVPLFSTPLVLWINTGNYYEYWESEYVEITNTDTQNIIKLEITSNVVKNAIIVDWQHRYKWLKRYFADNPNKNKDDLDIPVIFLFDYDLYELGKIFININFKQKPVNKSLYYDIFGSLPRPVSEIKIAHLLVQDLNSENGPLTWVVKMLGKWQGLISQSFLVEKLVELLNKSWVWLDKYNFLYETYKDRDENENVDLEIRVTEEYLEIKNFLFSYFEIIKSKFSNYTYEKSDDKLQAKWIIFKTTWIGALMRLIEDFYINNKQDELDTYFSKILSEGEELFSTGSNGKFSWAGSEWLQLKLYKTLAQKIFYWSAKEKIRKAIHDNFNVWEDFSFKDIHNKTIDSLKESYPNNNFLEAKLLQTLQSVRDEWDIEFVAWTRWKYKRLK